MKRQTLAQTVEEIQLLSTRHTWTWAGRPTGQDAPKSYLENKLSQMGCAGLGQNRLKHQRASPGQAVSIQWHSQSSKFQIFKFAKKATHKLEQIDSRVTSLIWYLLLPQRSGLELLILVNVMEIQLGVKSVKRAEKSTADPETKLAGPRWPKSGRAELNHSGF